MPLRAVAINQGPNKGGVKIFDDDRQVGGVYPERDRKIITGWQAIPPNRVYPTRAEAIAAVKKEVR